MAKKRIKTACLILVGLVLLFNLLTMALSGLGLRERLNWLPGAFLSVESGSMEPVLSEGDLLFVWETPYEELKPGDLVTFHGNNELVTHQIVRQDGSRFVTRGVANNVEDPSIGPEEYCAKVVLVVPKAGTALETLTNPSIVFLLSLFVFLLIYGYPIFCWIEKFCAGEKPGRIRPQLLRLTATAMLISVFYTAPYMTAAKYTADINEYASVSAGATYFTSNYLSDEGNIYYIQGWNGVGYGISLDIQNYENDLLFNQTGHDLHYQLEFRILSNADGKTYNTGYTLELRDGNEVLVPTGGKYGPYLLQGSADKGTSKRFEVALATEDNEPLSGGTLIRFQIIASTTDNTDFSQKLLGDFTFEATSATSFLGLRTLDSQAGSVLVTYTLQTELVEGASTRDVKVTWDNTKVYLNEYEEVAANIIANDNEHIRYVEDDGTGHGYLIMSLHAYSRVRLQFFKYNPQSTITVDDFTCTEVDLGATPEAT